MTLQPGLTLLRLGDHFPGFAVLHRVPDGSDDGVLLTGDTVQASADPRRVSFMWSYPHRIPLSPPSAS